MVTVESSLFMAERCKKYKKDVLRIASELMLEKTEELPVAVDADIHSFIDSLELEPFDQNSLKRYGLKTRMLLNY